MKNRTQVTTNLAHNNVTKKWEMEIKTTDYNNNSKTNSSHNARFRLGGKLCDDFDDFGDSNINK